MPLRLLSVIKLLRNVGAAKLEITTPSLLLAILLLMTTTRDRCPIAKPNPVSSKKLLRISPLLLPTAESPLAPLFLNRLSVTFTSAFPVRKSPSRLLLIKLLLAIATRLLDSTQTAVPLVSGLVTVMPSILVSLLVINATF